MPNESKNVGLLLVGHGTRDEVGTRQFLELAEGLKQQFVPLIVEAAFLELAQPDIDTGVGRLLAQGVNGIITVPVILFAAGHVKQDIPGHVGAALAARGRDDVRQVQVGHLGCHEAVVELSRLRMDEAGGRGQESGVSNQVSECLLLVARGSKDEAAADEMRQFAALRQAADTGISVEVAFLAIARPSLEERLVQLAAAIEKPATASRGIGSNFAPGYRRIIVQPHFLFEGELVERIRGQIARTALEQPQLEWIMAQSLGDPPGKPGLASELLAKVIRDRCEEGGIRVVVSTGDD